MMHPSTQHRRQDELQSILHPTAQRMEGNTMKTLKGLDQAITTLIETGSSNAKLTLTHEQVTKTFGHLGFPVTVPSWANWVATNANGAVYAYNACPVKDDAGFRGVQSVCVGWRPSQFASQWQSSLLEVS